MAIHLLGIRHHGTGSARRVVGYLESVKPDLVLVEGPPEFDALLKWIKPGLLEPPVAMLGYNKNNPQQASFYPFAEYSPEWQAILIANRRRIPVRLADLPLRYSFANQENKTMPLPGGGDPLAHLAQIDGGTSGESWWERRFETHNGATSDAEYFEAVLLAMTTLRQAGVPSALDAENPLREAWMRKMLREAHQQMYDNIVVVCGAWHVPALVNWAGSATTDEDLLAALPPDSVQVGASWVPWNNERLGRQSGYGAGIQSPGWSEHRWRYPHDTGKYWLSAVARLFRSRHMDISTAHVLEAERLAHTLAAMRQLPAPGLTEYNEATATVMCMGDQIILDWVRRELVVGHGMGKVPEKLPQLPLQVDFEANLKRLRLKPSEETKEIRLDLREAGNLEKSVFLHRVRALEIKWGACTADERSKGTFREIWILEWNPEMVIDIIAKAPWGNTVKEAASAWITDKTRQAKNINDLTQLIDHAFPGELFDVTDFIIRRLDEMAAVSTDVPDLMTAIQPFMRALRYGNVRKTDKTAIETLLSGIIVRICASLPVSGYQLDHDSAQRFFNLILLTNSALKTLENASWLEQWHSALFQLDDKSHPLIVGCATRLLFELGQLDQKNTAQRLSRALSKGYDPQFSASWIEGFLKGAGIALVYDDILWNILYDWTAQLPEDDFIPLLPVLRRTFTQFEPGDRRRLGEKAKQGRAVATTNEKDAVAEDLEDFDHNLALQALEAVALLIQ